MFISVYNRRSSILWRGAFLRRRDQFCSLKGGTLLAECRLHNRAKQRPRKAARNAPRSKLVSASSNPRKPIGKLSQLQGDTVGSTPIFSSGNFSKLNQPPSKVKASLANGLTLITSFDALRLFPTVRAAIVGEIKEGYTFKNTYMKSKDEVIIKPSPVQIASIRKICQPRKIDTKLQKSQVVPPENSIAREMMEKSAKNRLKVFTIAAETGLGKTWAYMAPLISKLKEADYALFSSSPQEYARERRSPHVRSVILVPTHELVDQVYASLERANNIKFDTEKLPSAARYGDFMCLPENQNSLGLGIFKWSSKDPPLHLFDRCHGEGRIDVLVTTPAKIAALDKLVNYRRPTRYFSLTEFCVFDEADTLLDDSWRADSTYALKIMPKCKDLVLCLATIPNEFKKTLERLFPNQDSLIQVATPSLHKIPPLISVKIIDAGKAPYNGQLDRCLAQALYAISKDGTEFGFVKRVLVFVNKADDVDATAELLMTKFLFDENDIKTVTGRMSAEERAEAIQPFVTPAIPIENGADASNLEILITTDLMSRGLNFNGLKNVVLMDIPRLLTDLVHRVGRTGRMRQSGRVFIIADAKKNNQFIKGLPNAIKRGNIIG